MSKKTKKILLIALGCIILVVLGFIYKWWVYIFLALCGWVWFFGTFMMYLTDTIHLLFVAAPPVPEIQYGEFPFEIVYSIDGEVFNKTDTMKYENAVYSDYDSLVKHQGWRAKHEEDAELLCEIDGYSIYLDCGNGYYYMQNEKNYDDYIPGEAMYWISGGSTHGITFEEAKEEFGVEIISTKFSEPIENGEGEYRTIDKIRLFLFGGGEDKTY
jgi:hypothetical protein